MEEQKSTVLIVDDQLLGRQLLESILYKEGYNLIFAENGEEAFAKTKEHLPDIILLDVMMPMMDGYETTRKIREDAKVKDVPVLLITALDDRDSKIKGFEAGADDYIVKPIDRVEVLTRVRTITRLNRYRRIYENKDSDDSTTSAKEEFKSDTKAVLALFHENLSAYPVEYFSHSKEKLSDITWSFSAGNKRYTFLWNVFNARKNDALLLNFYVNSKIKSILLQKLTNENISLKKTLKDLFASIKTNFSSTELKAFENSTLEFALCESNSNNHTLKYSGNSVNLLLAEGLDVNEISCGNYNIKLNEPVSEDTFSEKEQQISNSAKFFILPKSSFKSMEKDKIKDIISNINMIDDLIKIDFKELEINKEEESFFKLFATML